MTKKRDHVIDIMKFILIAMMVWFHIGIKTSFIHVFDMPVFFMISGIFFKNVSSFQDFRTFVWKKIKELYVPYILINLGFLAFHNLFVKINFYTSNPEILNFYPDIQLYNFYSLKDFIKRIVLILLFVGGTQRGGATWFLRSLFFSSAMYALVDFICSKLDITKKPVFHFFVGIVLLIIAFSLRNSTLVFLEKNALIWVRQCIVPYIFFPLGRTLYLYKNFLLNKIFLSISLVLSLIVLVFLCNFKIHRIHEGFISNPFFFLLGAVSGFIFTFSISKFISFLRIKNAIALFGQTTIYVLGLHLFVFKFVNLIFVARNNFSDFFIASFPSCYRLCSGLYLKIIYGWLYELLGVFIPVLISIFVKKMNLGRN